MWKGLKACNYIKKSLPTKVFSCEICEIFKNTHFEDMRTTASEEIEKSNSDFKKSEIMEL